jgi:hypothetical protein
LFGLLLYFVFSWQDLFAGQEWKMISREEAVTRAEAFWKAEQVDVKGLKVNAVIESARSVDGYLGKEDLRAEFEQAAPEHAPIVYWRVTFYSDKVGAEQEKYQTDLEPVTGKVVGFQRDDEGDREVSFEEAYALASGALQKLGVDTKHLEFDPERGMYEEFAEPIGDVEGYSLGYALPEFEVGALSLYYDVRVAGGKVTAVTYEYQVPHHFEVWHKKQVLYGSILTGISLLLTFVLVVFAFVYLFILKQKRPYWPSLWLSLLVMALFVFSNLNQWPIIESQALTAGGGLFEVLLVGAIFIAGILFLSVLAGGANYPLALTGGMLVREVNPELWLSRRDPDWSDRMRQAVRRGYLLAFVWMGFQGVFYYLGETYFGVWYEHDLSMSPANMQVPALFPLLAWLAGIQEEIAYRLFGVTFLKRYLKVSLLAVLLPAMVWALGHTLYPIYPVYTRFLELTIFGVIIGYCYLYYGLEAVIFAHVTFDTILMCIPLLLTGEPEQMTAAVAFLLLPMAVGYGLALLKPKSKPLDFA